MALYGDLSFDSRVRREARTLALAGYQVSLACLASAEERPDLPENVNIVTHRPIASPVLPGSRNPFFALAGGRISSTVERIRWLRDYIANLRAWGRSIAEACGPVDLWHLHDLTAMAAVVPTLDRHVPVVYDAHELFLETGTALRLPDPARALLRVYERRLVSRATAVITVNEELAGVLRTRYRPRRMTVVHNCPGRWTVTKPRRDLIRNAAGIPPGSPVILYHGSLSANRGVEQLMAALQMPGLATAHLVLLGTGDRRLELSATAAVHPASDRIHLLEPVPPRELLPWVSSADVGAMPIQASTLNHFLSTPNKLFECLAAGVPVVTSDFPAMRRIVLGDPLGPLGLVCDPSQTQEIAAALESLIERDPTERDALRGRCARAAWDRWNWEVESVRLLELYDDILRVAR